VPPPLARARTGQPRLYRLPHFRVSVRRQPRPSPDLRAARLLPSRSRSARSFTAEQFARGLGSWRFGLVAWALPGQLRVPADVRQGHPPGSAASCRPAATRLPARWPDHRAAAWSSPRAHGHPAVAGRDAADRPAPAPQRVPVSACTQPVTSWPFGAPAKHVAGSPPGNPPDDQRIRSTAQAQAPMTSTHTLDGMIRRARNRKTPLRSPGTARLPARYIAGLPEVNRYVRQRASGQAASPDVRAPDSCDLPCASHRPGCPGASA
jgi:hypothetical protein